MALSFLQKAKANKSGPSSGSASSSTTTNQTSFSSKPKTSQGKPGFLKKGKAAHEALAQEEARAELAKQSKGMYRFWMPEGEERHITFLDGDLDEDGVLDALAYFEHTLRVNGDIKQFVCTAEVDESQPCPLCEGGDRPALVHVFTVIDHSTYTIKTGPNAGKEIKNARKLFVAKRTSMQLLQKKAAKYGGLAGCRFEVSRLGDKSPGIGNSFDFVEKYESYDSIASACGLSLEDVTPADYEEEIKYLSPQELISLGFGTAHTGPGTGAGAAGLKGKL